MTADIRRAGMVDVFVERRGPAAAFVLDEADAAAACCSLHRACWQGSYVADAGRRICHYRAPDAESVRLALRTCGIAFDAVWTGTIHGDTQPAAEYLVVDLTFPPPLPAATIDALTLAQEEWLSPAGLTLVRAVVSNSRARVVCLCEAPNGNAALPANRRTPGELWSCRSFTAPAEGADPTG